MSKIIEELEETSSYEVVGISEKYGEYYICLENNKKIRVDKKEYQKMKRRLGNKGKSYIHVDEDTVYD